MPNYTTKELERFNKQRLSLMQYADNWKQRATTGTYQQYIASLSPVSAERNLFEAVERKAELYGLAAVTSTIKATAAKPPIRVRKQTAAQLKQQDLTRKYMASGYKKDDAERMAADPNYRQKRENQLYAFLISEGQSETDAKTKIDRHNLQAGISSDFQPEAA